VIMCSSYTDQGARSTLDALALGASDYVMKPARQNDLATAMETLASQLLPKIASLAGSGRLRRQVSPEGEAGRAASPAGPAGDFGMETAMDAPARHSGVSGAAGALVEIVVIGVSTGGPSALEAVLPKLTEDFPVPVMIVQHMPKLFTGALAERLDRCCPLRVREAQDGAELRAGTIWLAPGDAHMEASKPAGASAEGGGEGGPRRAVIQLHQQRPLNHCKPSVDYLFSSAARTYGAGTLALVMTGMGADGLTGARLVHESGGTVLTQDAATSAIWGMPGRVFQAGISREPLPLTRLAGELTLRVNAGRSGRGSGGASRKATAAPPKDETAATFARTEVTHELL